MELRLNSVNTKMKVFVKFAILRKYAKLCNVFFMVLDC